MISLIATLRVKEGKMDEAMAILKKAVPEMRKNEPGCLEYIPHTVKEDPQAIVFYEKYKDEDALATHSTNLPQTLGELFPLLEPGMDVKTCMEIL